MLGIFALVASLIFVGLQMRQEQNIAIAQIWAMSDQSVTELAALVSDNSSVWAKGLRGEELTEAEDVVFRSIAGAVFRRESNIASRVRRLDYGGGAISRVQIFAFNLYQYPGLRRAYEEYVAERQSQQSAFYASDGSPFYPAVLKALAELDQTSPPLPEPRLVPF